MTRLAMRAGVCGVGLIAPGISDWAAGAAMLAGRQAWQEAPLETPAAAFLPPAERRRVGQVVRLALACAHQAVADSGLAAGEIASVFASSDVDAENTHEICVALDQAEPSLSPTRFHNSVQNAVSGYWTILTGSRAPTTMVMGGDEILALGLLEAMAQATTSPRPVLLVVFDVAMPAPLFATRPIDGGGAVALVLAAGGGGPRIDARLTRLDRAGDGAGGHLDATDSSTGGDRGEPLVDPAVRLPPALRRVHPVGPALPLLGHLAAGTSGRLSLPFDRYHSLEITINCND
jgi:hypothetical protein